MPRERVLVIEDEPSMRRVLEDCLTRHGYRVVSANDGEDGLRRAVEEEPDLILLDVMMPKLDGFALCAELRRMGIGVPVLFLSAKAAVDDRVRGLDHGGDDYLSKPFSQSELLARVRALLRRGQASEEVLGRLELGDSEIDFGRRIATR